MLFDASADRLAQAADSIARLDEAVRAAPAGFSTVMMLRTAQQIASAGQSGAAGSGFEALLGWWYAAESREFVSLTDDTRETALAMDGLVEKRRAGRAFTPALVRESGFSIAPALADVLSAAHAEQWSALRLALMLATQTAAADDSRSSRIIRAAALMGVTCDALLDVPSHGEPGVVLEQVASDAVAMRSAVRRYLEATATAVLQCAEFGRGGHTARRLVEMLSAAPTTTIVGASAALGIAIPSIAASVERLEGVGVLREITGRARDRVFAYTPAVALEE